MLTEFNLHYNDISPNHFTTCVAFRLIVLLMSIVVRPVLAFIFSFIHTKETPLHLLVVFILLHARPIF